MPGGSLGFSRMLRSSRARAVAFAGTALTVAVLAASGCGSSPKPLTRAQLISRANAICRNVKAKVEAASKGRSASTPQQIERLTAKLSSLEEATLAELSSIVPPRALEDDWKRFVADAQTLAEDTSKLGEYVAAKNHAASNRLITSAAATQKQMAAIAKRDGFTECEQTL